MKKTLIAISFLLVGALGLWFGVVKPEPPFGADIKLTEISDIFSKIETYENEVLVNLGKYVQLKSDGKIRDGTSTELWDKSNWSGVADLPASSLLTYRVDVYHSKLGDGYIIIAEYEDANNWYAYERHFGPETYRDSTENKVTVHPKNPRQ